MASTSAVLRLARRTFVAALTVVSAVLGVCVVPAAAEIGAGDVASTTVVLDRKSTSDPLAQRVVRLHRRALQAQVAHQRASERLVLVEAQTVRLAEQSALAARLADNLYEQLADQPVGSVVSAVSNLMGGESMADRAEAAAADARYAEGLVALAQRGLTEARAEADRTKRHWKAARTEAERFEVEVAARTAARTAARQAEFGAGYRVDDPDQDRRNRTALRRWQDYLASLADAGVVPPAATVLENPRKLPAGFEPVRDRRGRLVPGVAEVDPDLSAPVLVLPAETIRAVSAAFSRVGLPDAHASLGADAYACGGLARQAWATSSVRIPADSVGQWETLATVRDGQLQVGDLAYLGDERVGVHQAGVYLGNRLMISADPNRGDVAVRRVPTGEMYGAKRVPLPAIDPTPAPAADGVPVGCGEVARATTDGDGIWTHPLPEGVWSLSSTFGAAGGLWSNGEHSGQDFAAALGTPVYAARGGVVTVENPDWAGNLVRVDHGAGVETWYAHLSRVVVEDGERVSAGAVLGAVGDEGNSTGPHLHFEVRLDGTAIDPLLLLDPAAPLSPWGGFANGEIPASELCAATGYGLKLRCDAAVAYRLMDAAFAAEIGYSLCITDGYRSREGQEQLFRTKPTLAAVPGTSNHGLGLAVDLCGGVEEFDTPEHRWMISNGPAFGWQHPNWAGQGGSRPEAWHFEFLPAS